ncbi:MAG: CHAP domain-containing protein [Oscillospiraceae bacterium]|nr:CHAP domain-containing protein [Oscillospiraceae bacterium]
MIPRKTIPQTDNLCYIAVSEGGLNPGIPRPNGSKLPFQNCVFYALGRFFELWGVCLSSTNAENFIESAKRQGLKTGNEPKPGAVIVWAKGKTGDSSDGAGHVAIVEQINADGSIVTSESGWSADKAFWTKTRKHDGNWGQSASYRFIGFVYPPETVSFFYPTRSLRQTSVGGDVKWLQHMLRCYGCYAGELDGSFGKLTLGGLLAFQFLHDLEVDGSCGAKTRAALTA